MSHTKEKPVMERQFMDVGYLSKIITNMIDEDTGESLDYSKSARAVEGNHRMMVSVLEECNDEVEGVSGIGQFFTYGLDLINNEDACVQAVVFMFVDKRDVNGNNESPLRGYSVTVDCEVCASWKTAEELATILIDLQSKCDEAMDLMEKGMVRRESLIGNPYRNE